MFLNEVVLYGRVNKVISSRRFNLRYFEVSDSVLLDSLKQGLYVYLRTLSTGSVNKPKIDINNIKFNGVRRVRLVLGDNEKSRFDFPVLEQVKGHRITEELKEHVLLLRNKRVQHSEVSFPLIATIGKLVSGDYYKLNEYESRFERTYNKAFVPIGKIMTLEKWGEFYSKNLKSEKVELGSFEAILELIASNANLTGEDSKLKSLILEISNRAISINGFSGITSLKNTQGVIFVSKDRNLSDDDIMRLVNIFPNLQFIVEK